MYNIKSEFIQETHAGDSLNILRHTTTDNNIYNITKNTIDECQHIIYDIRTLLGSVKKTYLEIYKHKHNNDQYHIASNDSHNKPSISSQLMLRHIMPTRVLSISALNNLNNIHTEWKQSQIHIDNPTPRPDYKIRNKYSDYTYLDGPSHDSELLHKMYTDIEYGGQQVEPFIDILVLNGNCTHLDIVRDWYNYMPLVTAGGFIAINNYKTSAIWYPQMHRGINDCLDEINGKNWNHIGCIPKNKDVGNLVRVNNFDSLDTNNSDINNSDNGSLDMVENMDMYGLSNIYIVQKCI